MIQTELLATGTVVGPHVDRPLDRDQELRAAAVRVFAANLGVGNVVDQKAALQTLARYPQIRRVLSNYQAINLVQEIDRVQEMMNKEEK